MFICLCDSLNIVKDVLIRIIFLSLLDVPQSPIFLHDRYSSPAAGSAKRRLFGDDPPTQSPVKRISVTPIKIIPNTSENNQNTTTTTTVFTMATGNGQHLTIPLPGTTFVFCWHLFDKKRHKNSYCCWRDGSSSFSDKEQHGRHHSHPTSGQWYEPPHRSTLTDRLPQPNHSSTRQLRHTATGRQQTPPHRIPRPLLQEGEDMCAGLLHLLLNEDLC